MTEPPPPPASEPETPATPATPTTGWVMPPLSARAPSPFRSAGTRARWVLGLLIANVAMSFLAIGVSLWGKALMTAFEAGTATMADLERFDSLHGLIGIGQTILYVATGIAWLAWSSRTIDNEDAIGIGPSKVSPHLAMVWWFVPFANLVMVPATHRDMYRRYHQGVRSSSVVVYAWFLAYVVNAIVGYLAGGAWLAAEDFAELQEGLNLWIVSDVLTAVAAILAIVMVRRIQARADLLATSATAAATPSDLPPAPAPDSPS